MNATQSVLDAAADAETLTNVMSRWYSRRGWTHTQVYRARADGWVAAAVWGTEGAVLYARWAARAAFRAVPDLRKPPLFVACCVCGRVKGGGPVLTDAEVSHTTCPTCWGPYLASQGLKALPYSGGSWE